MHRKERFVFNSGGSISKIGAPGNVPPMFFEGNFNGFAILKTDKDFLQQKNIERKRAKKFNMQSKATNVQSGNSEIMRLIDGFFDKFLRQRERGESGRVG